MKPCQVDWQKLVIHEKIYSVTEKSSCFACASYLVLKEMEESAGVSDALSKDKYTVMEILTPPDFSPALVCKLSAVSCDNATWHTNYKKPDASATLCKTFQTLYLCLTAQL